jgi:hypothetical protein
MRLIPDWFSDMVLGMAILYLPLTLVTFYVYGAEPLVTTGIGFAVDAWLSGAIGAVAGAIGYSLGALAFGWVLRILRYLFRSIVGLVR